MEEVPTEAGGGADRLKWVFVSGLSGAGKSTAASALEDVGFFTIENIPVENLPEIIQTLKKSNFDRVAIVVDVRSVRGKRELARKFSELVAKLREDGEDVDVIFLTASPEVLLERFALTRRPHPLAAVDEEGVTSKLIEREQMVMSPVRDVATWIIDTTRTTSRELRHRIMSLMGQSRMTVILESFGFKYGIPRDVDMLFDVRILRNPYYESDLRDKTGQDSDVKAYIEEDPMTPWMKMTIIRAILPTLHRYEDSGKRILLVAIGCSGGRHRSVYIADEVGQLLRNEGIHTVVVHRDMNREEND